MKRCVLWRASFTISPPLFAVLEVYTGWCGPCISMLASLKKIKLEKGGEDLILATVRADNVDTFKRLQNKSEPTWLLAVVRDANI